MITLLFFQQQRGSAEPAWAFRLDFNAGGRPGILASAAARLFQHGGIAFARELAVGVNRAGGVCPQ